MLNRDEIAQIKAELKAELLAELRLSLSKELTGGIGRAIKKILQVLSLNLGVELKLPKDMK